MEKIIWIEEHLEEALRLAWDEGHESALKLLDRLLNEEPGYARLHHTVGIIYFSHTKNISKAEQHFRLAIHFDNQFADPYWYLGKLLAEDNRFDDAFEIYKSGMKVRKPKELSC